MSNTFVHPLDKYLLSTYYMLGITPHAREKAMNKTDLVLILMDLTFYRGIQAINKERNKKISIQ